MNKIKVLNGTQIKFIAAFLMLLDHIHEMFYYVGAPIWLTMVGRLVFPMFLFIAADSFHYTSNKYKFLERLLIGTLFINAASFIIEQVLPNDNVVIMNNAFSTFLVVGVYSFFIDRLKSGIKNHDKKDILKAVFWFLLPVLTALPMIFMSGLIDKIMEIENPALKMPAMFLNYMLMTFPSLFTAEGGPILVALGIAFYIFRENRALQCLSLAVLSAILFAAGDIIQPLMVFAIIPMLMYNGEKGKGMKYFFYIFYPAHLYILYIISTVFFAK